MRVLEAIKNCESLWGQEVEISGRAHISSYMAVIYDDELCDQYPAIYPGILVHDDKLLEVIESLSEPPPVIVGSEILYSVHVVVRGIVTHTGQRFAPLRFGYIYELTIIEEGMETQTVKLGEYLKDITIVIERPLKAAEVKRLEPYFSEPRTIIQMKKFLESGENIIFASRVPESQVSYYEELLEEMKIEYSVKSSKIENGVIGAP